MGGKVSTSQVSKAARSVKNGKLSSEHSDKLTSVRQGNASDNHLETAQENIQGAIGKKDGNLIGRVQDLNVQSEFLHPKIVSKSERPLPQLRTTDMDPIEALVNIKKVPRGKFSLLQANTILEKHASNPMEHTAESLANEYNLDLQQTFFFLRHYSKMNLEAEMRAPESSAMKEIIAKGEEKKEAYKNFMQNLFVGKR